MAQAILLADVEGLGENGTAVEVSPGYLRNFLQPRGLAQPATPGALEEAIRRKEAAENASLLSKTVLTINHRAGDDGKLYGSVTTKEIAEAIRDARGIKVDKKKIRLDVPIHQVGTYMIDVEVAGGAIASVKTIVAEEK